MNYIKSAWDWHFSRQKVLWAVVTLKDGSIVYGYFGSKSFAGEELRDIYLQKVYKPETNGFATTEDNCGVLIAADQISTLEFYTDTGVSNAEDSGD